MKLKVVLISVVTLMNLSSAFACPSIKGIYTCVDTDRNGIQNDSLYDMSIDETIVDSRDSSEAVYIFKYPKTTFAVHANQSSLGGTDQIGNNSSRNYCAGKQSLTTVATIKDYQPSHTDTQTTTWTRGDNGKLYGVLSWTMDISAPGTLFSSDSYLCTPKP